MAVESLRRARQQVSGFLLRQGRVYSNGAHWTRKHRFWLAAQRFEHPARQIAFEELVQAMDEAQARRDRLAKQMQELLPSWSLAKIVAAIQALPGICLLYTSPNRGCTGRGTDSSRFIARAFPKRSHCLRDSYARWFPY